jgi:lipopolysaccharide/colanic/teichoic acid biosynthesis glycosyltransferase
MKMRNEIIDQYGIEVCNFIENFVQVDSKSNVIVDTSNIFNIENSSNYFNSKNAIINLKKVNDIRYINKFLKSINSKLNPDDIFIGCGQTIAARNKNKFLKKIPIFGSIFLLFEFIFLRITPKIWGIKKVYFFLTRGKNRLLSKAEILGRLVSCGFEIIEYKTINNLLYFSVKKIKDPISNNSKPSYGPLYKMPRMGKNGKIIGIYKFRTMHPYAEYLHDFILNQNGYAKTGKPADDFRLTPWGKFFRKYWIDELPQIINLIKGDIKIVGIRPVSIRFFQDIPKDLQVLRIKHKPGCIPPYISLNKSGSVEDVLNAERKYLIDKTNNPYTTDMKYFFNAVYNIIIRRKRSA